MELVTIMAMQVATPSPTRQNNWLPETEELYSQLRAKADKDGWVQVRNTNTDAKPSRCVFARVTTANGPVMNYALFLQKDKRKLMGVCQFGEEAQGPPGFAHGGAIATMHDAITGVLVDKSLEKPIVTASLSTHFRRPTPLRTAVQMEANIDRIEGKKIFTNSYLKSPDGTTLYSDCSALFVNIEDKLRALEEKSNSTL